MGSAAIDDAVTSLRPKPDTQPILERTRRRIRISDILFFGSLPLVLLVMYVAPESITQQLVVFPDRGPTVVTAYTAHFVHLKSGLFDGGRVTPEPMQTRRPRSQNI